MTRRSSTNVLQTRRLPKRSRSVEPCQRRVHSGHGRGLAASNTSPQRDGVSNDASSDSRRSRILSKSGRSTSLQESCTLIQFLKDYACDII